MVYFRYGESWPITKINYLSISDALNLRWKSVSLVAKMYYFPKDLIDEADDSGDLERPPESLVEEEALTKMKLLLGHLKDMVNTFLLKYDLTLKTVVEENWWDFVQWKWIKIFSHLDSTNELLYCFFHTVCPSILAANWKIFCHPSPKRRRASLTSCFMPTPSSTVSTPCAAPTPTPKMSLPNSKLSSTKTRMRWNLISKCHVRAHGVTGYRIPVFLLHFLMICDFFVDLGTWK